LCKEPRCQAIEWELNCRTETILRIVCLADVYGVGVDDRFWADSGRSVEWVLSDPTRHSSFSIAVIETLESGHRQRYVA